MLGEITPHPGWHAADRDPTWDRLLGIEFDKAWARLYKDLIQGVQFECYSKIYL